MVDLYYMDDKLLLVSLNRFYSSKKNLEEISSIILGTSKLSLRLIDWYVTTHCKRHNIVYILNNNEYFNVYLNYRSQLKAFKKTQFDPFRRRERITFSVDNDNNVYTTIGQLNFFRWAIQNKILKTIEKNLNHLETLMLSEQKNKFYSDITKQKSSIKHMTTFSGNAYISFA
mgnify:FL=1|tara:strand:+ start:38437 stop:38952 length:516 start_codon:yes stop_codon:yes gene_type:complete